MERFNRRLEQLPSEWRGPLVDVIDTAAAVRLALQDWDREGDSQLLLGLTQLVLEQHRRSQD